MTVTLFKNVGDYEAAAILKKAMKEGIVSQNVRMLTDVALGKFGHTDSLNSVWKFVKENFPYQSDPKDYELFIHPNRVALDYFNGISRSGDCVTGDTPVWIRSNERIELVEIRELLIPNGLYGIFSGYEIFTRKGFSKLISVKKKPTTKPILRIMGLSDTAVTSDHKIVSKKSGTQNIYVEADKADLSDLIYLSPKLQVHESKPIDYEFGWAMGLFFADGACSAGGISTNGKRLGSYWSICGINTELLERAKFILEKVYPFLVFDIRFNPSGAGNTNFGKRTKPLANLCTKLRTRTGDKIMTKFFVSQRRAFYNRCGTKIISHDILNGSVEIAKGFIDGVYAGDGSWGRICSGSKISTIGLVSLLDKISVPYIITADSNATSIGLRKLHKEPKTTRWRVPENKTVTEVYDICTEIGEFVAGNLVIKNCDDHALLTAAMLGSIGYQTRIILADCNFDGEIDHAFSQVHSEKLGWLNFDTSTEHPLGWILPYGKGITVEPN